MPSLMCVGKGGSGKTTLSTLVLEELLERQPCEPLLIIDTDVNQGLAGRLV